MVGCRQATYSSTAWGSRMSVQPTAPSRVSFGCASAKYSHSPRLPMLAVVGLSGSRSVVTALTLKRQERLMAETL